MKLVSSWLIAVLLCAGTFYGVDHRAPATRRWTIDLKNKFDFQPFDRPITFRWTLHQDVVFLPPDKLIVYQVNRAHGPVTLRPRDASGGGGNFVLDIRILSTADGHELAAMHLTTSADSSKVMATRDGRFIVRTGEILYLYSANFELIASKPLPLLRQVQEEDWQVDVSPSGAKIALVHQQIFKRNHLSPTSEVKWAGAEVEILREEDLQAIKSFKLPWFLASWSAGEDALISTKPAPDAERSTFGLLDFNGVWSPLLFAWYSPSQPCAYHAAAVDTRLFATYGCGTLSVFPQNGQVVFSLKGSSKEFVGAVKGNSNELAVVMDRHFTKMDRAANLVLEFVRPLRIDVYDVKSHKGIFSAPVNGERVYYTLSTQGAVAAVDGTSLTLYQPAR
ncbi:MAG TPA: hypothetical protein VKQ89_03415 [Candidatus Angelobacter sp.]|nr:hypothetical protein [Candidatus Angelobacter sp.]